MNELLLSTLNYDLLLEIAMSMNGFTVDYFGEIDSENASLLKLHGSCNFVSANIGVGQGVSVGLGVNIEGGLRPINPDEVVEYCREKTGIYPAMALIRPDKHVQIGSEVIQRIQEKWAAAVQNAEQVAVVGVYPLPHDEHIWNIVADSNAELFYIGSRDAFEKWCGEERPGKHNAFLSNRFKDGFEDLIDCLN